MSHREPTPLVIAVRVYPDLKDEDRTFDRPKRAWNRPEAMLVFDAESRTDRTQRLTFGSYRSIIAGELARESLFYGDDLPIKDRRILEHHVAKPSAVVPAEDTHDVSLLTRDQFANKLFKNAYKGRCLLIAFNFPFDISRVACNFANARGRFAGGFSLDLWSYADGRNRFRPSICIKHIDSKRALKGFTRRKEPDEEDLIPEGSTNRSTRRRLRLSGPFPGPANTRVCAHRQELHAGKGVRGFRRRARKTAGGSARNRHQQIHQLQPARCSRNIGTSRKVAGRIRQARYRATGNKSIFARINRQSVSAQNGNQTDFAAPTQFSQIVSWVCAISVFWRTNQRAHSQSPGSHRLHRFSFNVSHGQ